MDCRVCKAPGMCICSPAERPSHGEFASALIEKLSVSCGLSYEQLKEDWKAPAESVPAIRFELKVVPMSDPNADPDWTPASDAACVYLGDKKFLPFWRDLDITKLDLPEGHFLAAIRRVV